MIKVQGLGRRHSGISHADAIAHHRTVHSKLGLQADHMDRYILYYFREALNADGAALPDFPWDMSALEWFRDDAYWANFQEWLTSAPEGQEVKTDEAHFLDRDQCFMLPYEEQIVVKADDDADVIDLLRLHSLAPGLSGQAAADRHTDGSIPAIKDHFGAALRKLVVNRVTEATCLASGRIPVSPVDVIEIYKIDRAAFGDTADLVRAFAAPAIAAAEAAVFASDRTINLVAEEVVFIP